MKQRQKKISCNDAKPEKNTGGKDMNPRNLQIAYVMIKRFRKKLVNSCPVNCGGCPFDAHICLEADAIIAHIKSALDKKRNNEPHANP
jgi:hypothetical protein